MVDKEAKFEIKCHILTDIVRRRVRPAYVPPHHNVVGMVSGRDRLIHYEELKCSSTGFVTGQCGLGKASMAHTRLTGVSAAPAAVKAIQGLNRVDNRQDFTLLTIAGR